jgi:tRNA pseudouridine-54 N-methylase
MSFPEWLATRIVRRHRAKTSSDDRLKIHFATHGPLTLLARCVHTTHEAEQMYIGGGLVGTVLIVLLVLFVMGRL